jgi:hypothetical protein
MFAGDNGGLASSQPLAPYSQDYGTNFSQMYAKAIKFLGGTTERRLLQILFMCNHEEGSIV